MTTIYPYPWPIGTCHYRELPEGIQTQLSKLIIDGVLDSSIVVHRTPTEGAYISFAGWKVRAMIENTGPTTWIARLA